MIVKTCLRYPGGKFYGRKHLKRFLEIDHDEYREPFVGGGSIKCRVSLKIFYEKKT